MQFYDMPGRDAVLRHTGVGTQFYDLRWSGCSFTTCLVVTQIHDIPWSERNLTTYPDRKADLRNGLYNLKQSNHYKIRTLTELVINNVHIANILRKICAK